MPRPLKVYRTAVGFRDAYVAAPSKAAALRAWGTEKDLFARGAAEVVTDPALTKAALQAPGDVVYQTRGGLAEQVAALGPLPKASKKSAAPKSAKPAPKRKPSPRPSRADLDAAEAAIAALHAKQERAEAMMRDKERALAKEREDMEQRHAEQRAKLERAADKARKSYQDALQDWEP